MRIKKLVFLLSLLFSSFYMTFSLDARTTQKCNQCHDLEILPRSPYARYALPLDYPPSRRCSPRYGYTQPPLQALMEFFTSYEKSYQEMLVYMSSLDVSHIPVNYLPNSQSPSWIGGPINAFDTLALYAFITKFRPKIFLEIGSGMTTRFAKQAILDNQLDTKIISIDPQPRSEIDQICDEIIRDGVEICDLTLFDQLEAGDIVFMDGSHRSFMNSDVTIFFLEVLPKLKPGVIIHIHDVVLPWDYPPMFQDWYWNEQYLLGVYLMAGLEKIDPLFPTYFVSKSVFFNEFFHPPMDLGIHNNTWLSGGSMWFTHKESIIKKTSYE